MDINNQAHVQAWCDVMNHSYDDCYFEIESAIKYLTNHLYLRDTETFLFVDCSNNQDSTQSNDTNSNIEDVCASISVGRYQCNPEISSLFRIGVIKGHQGRQLGRAVMLYGLSHLQLNGYKLCEDIVTSKRHASLMLHMNLGFEPQFDLSKVTYTKNLSNINIWQKMKLMKLLRKESNTYKKLLSDKFAR